MGRVAACSSPSASIVVHPYFPVRVEMNGVADMRKHDDLGNVRALSTNKVSDCIVRRWYWAA
jgi:hypothetical protein